MAPDPFSGRLVPVRDFDHEAVEFLAPDLETAQQLARRYGFPAATLVAAPVDPQPDLFTPPARGPEAA